MSDAVLGAIAQANDGFYRAFESGRIERMEGVWSCSSQDSCIHPGWPVLSGWDDIRQSWIGIFSGSRDIRIEVEEVDIEVLGASARVTCVERFSATAGGMPVSATVAATNLFVRDGERWVLVHHHGSPLMREREPERAPSPPRTETIH